MAHSTAQPDSAAHLVLSLSCPDRPGIVHAVTGTLARRGGNITESKQFGDSSTGLFFMRVQVLTTVPRVELEKDLAELAGEYEMEWSLDEVGRAMRTLIMVSKEGHCLTDLLFRARSQGLPVDVVGVVGNHETLRDVAEFYGVPFHHIAVTKDTKEAAEAELLGPRGPGGHAAGQGAGRRAPGSGAGGALAHRAPGTAQRAPHRRLRLSTARAHHQPAVFPPLAHHDDGRSPHYRT